MPSRRKRKRERRTSAEATASPSEGRGGWGRGLPIKAQDMYLVRRSIRERWQTPVPIRSYVVADITQVALEDGAGIRRVMAAVHVLVEMEGENQTRELAELMKPPLERNPFPRFWPLS